MRRGSRELDERDWLLALLFVLLAILATFGGGLFLTSCATSVAIGSLSETWWIETAAVLRAVALDLLRLLALLGL